MIVPLQYFIWRITMNRSVVVYYENQELEEGIISSVKGHLKRNWGKYALGAAALGTGVMVANPALASQAGATVGKTLTNVGAKAGELAGKAGIAAREGANQIRDKLGMATRRTPINTPNATKLLQKPLRPKFI